MEEQAEFDIKVLAAYVALAIYHNEGIPMGICPKCKIESGGYLMLNGWKSWKDREGGVYLSCTECDFSETLYEGEIKPLEWDE